MRVFVSGLYSGPNPSPGVGVARSLRAAYPDAEIVGVDYSSRSTGFHWPEFDEVWVARPWARLDLDEHRRQIEARLTGGAYWISGLDLEVAWLSSVFGPRSSMLSPSAASLGAVRKPPSLPTELGLRTPEHVSLDESDKALAGFCRDHDWLVWVKGPFYEARLVRNWRQFQVARAELTETWGQGSGLFVQAHVTGREGSIALSASNGSLVAAVEMMKSEITPEGKTWAGRVAPLSRDIEGALKEYVSSIGWHGGAEAEFVEDEDGGRWMIEWNPRFPAWIHGATLAGMNLPGTLVEAASGVPRRVGAPFAAAEFARVVIEVRTRAGLPLHEPRVEGSSGPLGGKHPSGMPELARRLSRISPRVPRGTVRPVDLGLGDVKTVITPARLFVAGAAARAIDGAADLARSASTARVRVDVAISVKTDPRPEILSLALQADLMAEAISQLEARSAARAGFPPDRLILNGPGKWWPVRYVEAPVHALFFDSIEESESLDARTSHADASHHVGPRLRLPSTASRFGVPLERPEDLERLVRSLRTSSRGRDLAVHFHLASSDLGPAKWFRLAASILEWSADLDETVAPVRLIDLGGGWHPDDWEAHLVPNLACFVEAAESKLQGLRGVVVEPGKALTQRSSYLVTRVLESRLQGDRVEVVLDASIAELPLATAIVRQIFRLGSDGWEELAAGPDRALGRLCMEDDVLARNLDLRELKEGDFVAFSDAGAYDRSMAYEFGRGY